MIGPVSRVVSVLPSATEVLCVIGAEHMLVGRSHEDNYPPSITDRPILTGQKTPTEWTSAKEIDTQVSQMLAQGQSLYTLDEALLQELHPDVILTQDICAVCAIDLGTVQRVAKNIIPSPKVISLNPQNLQDVLLDIELVGDAIGMREEAAAATRRFEARIAAATSHVPTQAKPVNVAFIEWSDPIYVGGHWTPQIIKMAGGSHPLNPSGDGAEGLYVQTGGAGKSFPVPHEKVVESDPDLIIVCPCGLKIEQARQEAENLYSKAWFRELRAVKAGEVYIVDGDAMFNRPGPRLVDALEWLVSLLQAKPELCPDNFPVERFAPPSTPKPKQAVPDIEELHEQACLEGKFQYKDPATGYTVISKLGHQKRGYCCGHRCRHCPYGHFNVKPGNRLNSLSNVTYLRVEGPETTFEQSGVDILFWSGGKDSYLTYLQHDRKRKLVLCNTYEGESGMILHQGVHHHKVMDQAKKLKLDLVLAPLPSRNTNEEYLAVVEQAVSLAAKEAKTEDVRCLFGDLHLSDIRNWRVKNHKWSCVFPIFDTPYTELYDTLFAQDATIEISASSHESAPVGTAFTRDFIASLPEGVDKMGENGEFHTLVTLL